jgi:cytochrome c
MIAAADLNKGKVLYLQCRACHSLVPEAEPGKIGPTLYGIIGQKAGTAPGYAYSEAVAKSGITWTADQIDKWLERPSEFLPGNKMVFVGIQQPQDRANIIAYIRDESAKPAPQ